LRDVIRPRPRPSHLRRLSTAMPTRFRVHDTNVAWRVADDEAVVLHSDSSAYFGLNQVGTLLWVQLAEHPMTLDQVSAWARSAFRDTPADLPDSVAKFIDDLLELDLIEREESTNGAAPGQALEAAKPAVLPPWEPPALERFGELEKLILSGE
jgi:hypothetical protein